jgi:hypothetical protein
VLFRSSPFSVNIDLIPIALSLISVRRLIHFNYLSLWNRNLHWAMWGNGDLEIGSTYLKNGTTCSLAWTRDERSSGRMICLVHLTNGGSKSRIDPDFGHSGHCKHTSLIEQPSPLLKPPTVSLKVPNKRRWSHFSAHRWPAASKGWGSGAALWPTSQFDRSIFCTLSRCQALAKLVFTVINTIDKWPSSRNSWDVRRPHGTGPSSLELSLQRFDRISFNSNQQQATYTQC